MTDDARAVLARRVFRVWAAMCALGGGASVLLAAWLVLLGEGGAWPARIGEALPPAVMGALGLWLARRLWGRSARVSP